jgi:hypothetical protein
MNNRRAVLISLLVLGLLLVGGGIWWKMDLSSKDNSSKVVIRPVITMAVSDDNVDSHDTLYICEDGSTYVIWEIDARPDLGREWSKIYRKGQLSPSELDALAQLLKDNLENVQDIYEFPGYVGGTEGQIMKGHMDTVLTIKYQGMARQITANDYLGMYSSYLPQDSMYAGMPAPLDKICHRLFEISAMTEEFYKETAP